DAVDLDLPAAGVGARLEDGQRRAVADGARRDLALGPAAQLGAARRPILAGQRVQPGGILGGRQDLRDVALEVVAQDDVAVGQGVGEMREGAHCRTLTVLCRAVEEVVYRVRRSERARRVRVTVDPARGVEVVLPRRAPEREAAAAVR